MILLEPFHYYSLMDGAEANLLYKFKEKGILLQLVNLRINWHISDMES